MNSQPLQLKIDESCRHLEKTAKELGLTLSKDLSSTNALEEIIRGLKDYGVDADVMKGATFLVGVYLGEVLRHAMGGTWTTSSDGEFVLKIGPVECFPVAKVRKFAAASSSDDDLTFFAKAFVAKWGNDRDA
jgi:hypothetical protein